MHSQRFAELRTRLDSSPSIESFQQLLRFFRDWPTSEEKSLALEYANAHLDSWPDHTRSMQTLDKHSPYWGLARSIELQQKMRPKALLKAFQGEHLTTIRTLSLKKSGAKPRFLTFLFQQPELSNIRELRLSEGTLHLLQEASSLETNGMSILSLTLKAMQWTSESLRSVLSLPAFQDLERLELSDCEVNKDFFSILASLPCASTLRSIAFNPCCFEENPFQTLESSAVFPALESLVFFDNTEHSASLEMLTTLPELPSFPALTSLHLEGLELAPQLRDGFAKAQWPLTSLIVRNCWMGQNGRVRFLSKAPFLSSLEHLEWSCRSHYGFDWFLWWDRAVTRQLTKLKRLILRGVSLTEDALEPLSSSEGWSALEELQWKQAALEIRQWQQLFSSPNLRSLTSLSFYEAQGLTGHLLTLCKNTSIRSLKTLRLLESRLVSTDVLPLAAVTHWEKLNTLILNKNPIGSEGCHALLHESCLPEDLYLNLEQTLASSEQELYAQSFSNVHVSNKEEEERLEKLVDELPEMSHYGFEERMVRLEEVRQQWKGSIRFPEVVRLLNHKLTDHDGSRYPFWGIAPEHHWWDLSTHLLLDCQNPTNLKNLEVLTFEECEHILWLTLGGGTLGEKDIKALAASGLLSGLEALSFVDISFSTKGVECLLEVLENECRTLSLERCVMAEDTACLFFSGDCWSELVELRIEDCKARDEWLKVIGESIFAPALKTLRLKNNQLTAAGVESFLSNLGFAELQDLRLCNNPLGDRAAKDLASTDALEELKTLSMTSCQLTEEGVRALARTSYWQALDCLMITGNELAEEVLFEELLTRFTANKAVFSDDYARALEEPMHPDFAQFRKHMRKQIEQYYIRCAKVDIPALRFTRFSPFEPDPRLTKSQPSQQTS